MRGCSLQNDAGPGRVAWFGVVLLLSAAWFSMPVHAGMPHGVHELEPRVAPALELIDIDGRKHRIEDYRGQVLVVSFWSTWCLPCRDELPGMVRTARALDSDGVRFVTVAMGQDAVEVNAYLARYPFDLPKLLDPTSKVSEAWRVQGLPTSFVVDPDGRLVLQVVGAYDWESKEILTRLRAQSR
jgi:thiol-disulfide isomerase/thioredoxin